MAKISDLNPTTTIESSDLVAIVDASDTAMSLAGSNKKITMLTLAQGLSTIGNYGSIAGPTYSLATTTSNGLMSFTDKTRIDDAAAVNGVIRCNGFGDFSPASNATPSVAGLMSSTDKTRLDDASGVNGIVACNGNGDFSPASNATTSVAGLMSAADKTKLDGLTGVIADGSITAPKLNGGQTGSAPIYCARAWVNFNGTGTPAIRSSGNVSSITEWGTGRYTVNLTTAVNNINGAVVSGGSEGDATVGDHNQWVSSYLSSGTTVEVIIETAGSNRADNKYISVAVFG